MSLIKHAERELKAAGLFDKDSDYEGEIGNAVMELVKVFSTQGHSGQSAAMTIAFFHKVASYKLITPLKNPMETGEYMEVASNILQSTRLSSVFSDDGGKTWHDIDTPVPFWMKMRGIRKVKIHNWPYKG